MSKKNRILCAPVECVKRRKEHNEEELAWAQEIMEMYGCRPINKENARCMRDFVMDVFAAGRISGVREERARRMINANR